MKRLKGLAALTMAAVMAASLTACGGSPSGQSGSSAADGVQSGTPGEGGGSGKTYQVALLADGAGLGSQSFNDVALEGLNRAEADFGIKITTLEVKEATDFANSLRSLCQQGMDLIIIPGAAVKDAAVEVSPEYPNVYFGLLDVQAEGDNIVSASYREQEAAFLLGALGAKVTKAKQIGFVGGVSGVIQDRFQFGYMAGANHVDPSVKVVTSYTGSFGDVGKGKEIASMMYSDGCDFVAPSAGACNLGVFQASQEAGADKWCFGAANGQFHLMPDQIVASQVKRVDNVAYDIVKSLVEGTIKGGSTEYGLVDGGVDLLYATEEAPAALVSEEVRKEIEDLRNQVIDGTIKVPVNQAEYDEFVK